MATIKNAVGNAFHKALYLHRLRAHDAPRKQKFARCCKTLGLDAPWADYERAREHAATLVREAAR